MKKRRTKILIILLSYLVISFIVLYYGTTTKLKFSHAPGFYEHEIQLELLGAEYNDVFYTLDGSEPTRDSKEYTGPILIYDMSNNENIYASRADVSTGLYDSLVTEYTGKKSEYRIPDYLVDKCCVVRAAIIDQNGKIIEQISGSYFIGYDAKENYENLYMASIITDPNNLFDYEKGIYVTGKAFDNIKDRIPELYETPASWWWWDANYSGRGREWEREAHVSIWNLQREEVVSQDCGIKIQGKGSRALLPKTLGVVARTEYSGVDELEGDIFGTGNNSRKIKIFSGGTDCNYKIKDYVVHSMVSDLSFSTMKFIPCALFLDGEYWGCYYLTENYDKDYVADYYGVDPDSVIIQKADMLSEGVEDDIVLYREMRKYIAESDMTDEQNYIEACKLIDIESYIDYYASQIFIARYGDWPIGNEACWRTRGIDYNKPYADGKWRWMLYDVNSGGLTLDCIERDTIAEVKEADVVFNSLWENDNFRKQFLDRLVYISEEVYKKEKYDFVIDAYLDIMVPPIEDSMRRFQGERHTDKIIANAENMRIFFDRRKEFIKVLVEKYS